MNGDVLDSAGVLSAAGHQGPFAPGERKLNLEACPESRRILYHKVNSIDKKMPFERAKAAANCRRWPVDFGPGGVSIT